MNHSSPANLRDWQTVLAIDSDKWACAVYRANFPGVRVECGPVADFIGTLPYADIILGGFPCQPHSLAGKRKASSDSRDGGDDFVAAIAKVRPRMFLGENVAGILSSEDGRYVQRLVKRMGEAGYEAGYEVQIKTLDAVNFGVPQFRNRVWFWGIRADLYRDGMRQSWPKPTHAWPPPEPCMFGMQLQAGVTVGQALNIGDFIRHVRGAGVERRDHPPTEPSPKIYDLGAPGTGLQVIRGSNGKEDVSGQMQQMREFAATVSAGSCGNIEGDGESVALCGLRSTEIRVHGGRRTGGPGHEVPERDITEEPAQTLGDMGHGLRNGEPRLVIQSHAERPTAEPSPTVQAGSRSGGGDGIYVRRDRGAGLLERGGERRTLKAGGNYDGTGKQGGGCPPVVAYRWSDAMLQKHPPASPASTVQAKYFKGGAEGLLQWKKTADGLWVRRLTPLECLRLQSGPDDFRWPDGIGKTAMYRCIGNGQASLMVYRLRQCIEMVDPDSKTVIDLFCGGGIGAVGWAGRFWSYDAEGVLA